MDAFNEYIQQGGIFIYPIIVGTLWALILILERAIFYLQTATRLTRQGDRIFAILSEQGIDALKQHLDKQRGLISNVLSVAIEHQSMPLDRIEDKMRATLVKYLPGYSKYLNLLAALATIMPILGLLGTVTGMIATFKVIALQGTGDAQAMADGISEALITTQAGLIAAVPIIIGHTLLSNRLRKITDKTKEICTQFIEYLKDEHDRQSI